MASPCKKLKLTPKRSQRLSSQQTLQSKVTSTPQSLNEIVASPNTSRISSTASTSRNIPRRRLTDVFRENNEATSYVTELSEEGCTSLSSNTVSTSEKSVITGEDYDECINNFGKVKYSGNVWKLFKPLQDDTLYAQLLQEPQNAQETVTEFLLLYNEKPEVAICNLLQLCVDVCGYQNFHVSTHYRLQENSAEHIIKLMESQKVIEEQEHLCRTGKYLLMESRSNLASLLRMSIYNFLQKLILCAHERGILYDGFFSKHFFLFIKAISFSEVRAVRHTGVIFVIKVLTAVVMIYNKILNDADYSTDAENDLNTSLENNLHMRKRDVNMFIESLYLVFIKNCRLQDNKVTLMRVDCIRELSIWIRYFPKIFITQLQGVNYLVKLILDQSNNVRYAALETLEALVKTPSVLAVLKDFVPGFTETVGKRFYDVDNKVAIKAIDIFGTFLKYDESLISTHQFMLLTDLVFDKSFKIGEAAARFLTYYLKQTEKDQTGILIQLAKVSMKPGDATVQLLIEGCLYNCSVIKDWETYMNILLDDNMDMDIKQALAKMFAESVYQTLTGTSSIVRDMSRKVTSIDPSEHIKVAQQFPRFNTLLQTYKHYPETLVEFLKILCLVNNAVLNGNYCPHYTKICTTMEILFSEHSDEGLINKIAETFHNFCSIPNFANRATVQPCNRVTENICSTYVNYLLIYLSQPTQETSEVVLKVAALFSYFNLSKKMTWEALFDRWSESDDTTTIHLLICCKWYLIWSLRNIINMDHTARSKLPNHFPLLSRTCKEFISTCFNMLQNLNGQPLHFKVYEVLCDVHITYMKDLENPVKSVKRLEVLRLIIDDKQIQNLLTSFLDKYVIANTKMSLFDRRTNVVKYVDLVHHNVLPIERLCYIFKYYYAYNDEFGPIIESSLRDMTKADDENIILMMITYTLTIVYEKIVDRYGVIDLRTDEIKDLKLLIKQFLMFKELRSSNRNFKKLLYFSFNYAFKDQSKYSYLYFVKYFVDLLDGGDKAEILDFFKKRLPKDAEKNDAVLYIANYIKSFKPTSEGLQKTIKKIEKTSKENRTNKQAKDTSVRKRGRSKGPNNQTKNKAKLNSRTKKKVETDSETEVSRDDLTIHDSESDDLGESLQRLHV